MIAVLFAQLAAIFFLEGLRFGAGAPHLAPWPASATFWAMSTGVLGGLAFLRIRRHGLSLAVLRWRVAVAWGLWVIVPAAIWSVGDQVTEVGPEPWLLGAGFLVAAFALHRDRGEWSGSVLRGDSRANGLCGLGLLAGVAFFLILRSTGDGPEVATSSAEWAVALATYPLYAFGQLLVFLVLPGVFMRREGYGTATTVVVSSALFAMVHWPNPALTVVTALAMVLWSWLWRRGASLLWIAFGMGWMGALLAQGLAPATMGYMRVGPGYVLRMQQVDHLEDFEARVRFLASDEAYDAVGGELEPWLDWLHREVFGEAPTPTFQGAWIEHIEAAVRARMLRTFYDSPEFARRHGEQPVIRGRAHRLLSPLFRPRGSAQQSYDELRSAASFAASGRDFRRYLAMLYRTLLGREPAAAELDAWPISPQLHERVEVVRMFMWAGPERDLYIWKFEDTEFWWPSAPAPATN
jgi:hypothetical protein